MAGGPNAASVMCILCAEKADRISQGMETDRYSCTVCGGTFLINWYETEPDRPCWPPDPEDRASLKAAIAARSGVSRKAPAAGGVRPDRGEAADYYFTYIDQVGQGDIADILDRQQHEVMALLRDIPEARSLTRYAPDKWTIRQVVGHVNDCERLFVARAFWFARGFDSPLPSFDQHVAAAAADSDRRLWHTLLEEFGCVRAATLAFFRYLPEDAWSRRGVASGNPFTVRALAYIAAGHVAHHMRIVRERYLSI